MLNGRTSRGHVGSYEPNLPESLFERGHDDPSYFRRKRFYKTNEVCVGNDVRYII